MKMQKIFKTLLFISVFSLFFLSYPAPGLQDSIISYTRPAQLADNSRIISSTASAEELPQSRIISLTPASTEILFALGLEDEIVGVSSYCDWPAEAREKESVGSFSNPNIEKIVSLRPELVILTGMEQGYLKAILSNLSIDYVVIHPSNLKGLILSIEEIANLTNRKKQAEVLIRNIKKVMRRIGRAVSKVPEGDRPLVYVEFWHDPIMTIGGDSFINDMIETCGGINITKDLKRSYSKIDPEVVIFRNPEVIILTYHMKDKGWIKERFASRIGWQNIDAVKNKRIYQDIDPDIILRPGPRVIEGLIELHRRFYED